MRVTYEAVPFDFEQAVTSWQRPRRIIIHRQGNLGAEGESGIAWGKRTGAFTIHRYIDDGRCFIAIPLDRHAFHVSATTVARARGMRVDGDYGPRGDYDSVGVEMEDESPQTTPLAPGQHYGLSRETRITAVQVVADIIRECNSAPGATIMLTVADIDEHATWDPDQRPEDLGEALNVQDFREDVQDVLDGREPWRTVGEFATGARAPLSWKPVETSTPTLADRLRAEMVRHNDAVEAIIRGG